MRVRVRVRVMDPAKHLIALCRGAPSSAQDIDMSSSQVGQKGNGSDSTTVSGVRIKAETEVIVEIRFLSRSPSSLQHLPLQHLPCLSSPTSSRFNGHITTQVSIFEQPDGPRG